MQVVGLGKRTHAVTTADLCALTQYLPVNQLVCHPHHVLPLTTTLGAMAESTAGCIPAT